MKMNQDEDDEDDFEKSEDVDLKKIDVSKSPFKVPSKPILS